MYSYQEKTALITGASSGIGAEFAKALAARKMNLVLVARSTERLQTLASALSQQHGIRAEVMTADLSEGEASKRIMEEVHGKNLRVDLLINNAAFGLYGYFEALSPERSHEQVMVNIAALIALTYEVIPSMLERPQESAIINVASMAAFQPVPYMAVYGATKAFVLSFSLALAEEYRQRGLQVLTLVPGATDTGFYNTSGDVAAANRRRTPEQVATTGLRGLEQGRDLVVDGRMNRVMALLSSMSPAPLGARLMGRLNRPEHSGSQTE